MTDPTDKTTDTAPDPSCGRTWRARWTLGALVILAAMAAGAGADALAHRRHVITYVALTPIPIAKLEAGTTAAVKGKVAEIFGNKFVVEDPTGRALVETGRAGEGGRLVDRAEEVTVQGRFDRGFVHAVAITHADGRVAPLDPPPPPPPGPAMLPRG